MIKYVDYIQHTIGTDCIPTVEANDQTDKLNNCIDFILDVVESLESVGKAYKSPEDAPGYTDYLQGRGLLETVTGKDFDTMLTVREEWGNVEKV